MKLKTQTEIEELIMTATDLAKTAIILYCVDNGLNFVNLIQKEIRYKSTAFDCEHANMHNDNGFIIEYELSISEKRMIEFSVSFFYDQEDARIEDIKIWATNYVIKYKKLRFNKVVGGIHTQKFDLMGKVLTTEKWILNQYGEFTTEFIHSNV